MNDELIKLAAHVLLTAGGKAKLRSTEIAEAVVSQRLLIGLRDKGFNIAVFDDPIVLSQRIGQALTLHVKKVPASKRIVTGKVSGWELGSRANRGIAAASETHALPTTTLYTGAVGEFAVMSELLGCDWNAAQIAMDDGIDVIATQGAEIRTVQVKTAHSPTYSPERFVFNLDRRADELYGAVTHYYILVMRRMKPKRWENDFLILPSKEVRRLNADGLITKDKDGNWRVSVTVEAENYTVGERDLTDFVNDFRRNFV